jgi:hypothetical protein
VLNQDTVVICLVILAIVTVLSLRPGLDAPEPSDGDDPTGSR